MTAGQRLREHAYVVHGVARRPGEREDERVGHQGLPAALREELRQEQEDHAPERGKFIVAPSVIWQTP